MAIGVEPAAAFVLGGAAAWRYVEFRNANICNPNTRRSSVRACGRFFGWCQQNGLPLAEIRPFSVAAFIEELHREVSAPSLKRRLAATRTLCDWLVTGQVMPPTPASPVRGRK